MKTYTGATGYVYQYYFVGKRPALEGNLAGAATEYIFDATPDRKVTYAISVLLPRTALAAWAAAHGRELTDPEEYAAAKMRLLQGFDEVENFREWNRQLVIDAAGLEELLASLGLE